MSAQPDNSITRAPAAFGDELLSFADDSSGVVPRRRTSDNPWKILIADDDDAVHSISRMVLRDFEFEGRGLVFISAHSGLETQRMVEAHPDAAILLLDVVMESDNAGLDVVRHVRDVMRNRFMRIILRTGQPGQAPERWVVVNYDINDYREKTELTAQKLVTTVVSALRAYRDIQIIEASRRGLEQIVGASRDLFEPQSLAQFSAGVLNQLTALLNLGADSLFLQSSGFAAKRDHAHEQDAFTILAGTGQFEMAVGRNLHEAVPGHVLQRLLAAREAGRTLVDGNEFAGYFKTSNGSENMVYLHTRRSLGEMDVHLLKVFASNVAIAFDNIYLNDEITSTQVELILTLSEVVETRSKETGRHVFRVGEYSHLMGSKIGLSPRECDLLRMAAPMHDLGKIGISDAILCKPGRLTAPEFEAMKRHTTIGHDILKGSRRDGLRAAAIVALHHHECWDGSGYPAGLAGEQIHIFGRIVGMADVFDALANKRIYKEAWPIDQVMAYIANLSGTKFDPRLVQVIRDHLDEFVDILRRYPD